MSVYAVWLPEYESYAKFGSYSRIALFKDANHASLFCSFLQAKARVSRTVSSSSQVGKKLVDIKRAELHEFRLVRI